MIDTFQPDELMMTGILHDHSARVRSFKIAAEVLADLREDAVVASVWDGPERLLVLVSALHCRFPRSSRSGYASDADRRQPLPSFSRIRRGVTVQPFPAAILVLVLLLMPAGARRRV